MNAKITLTFIFIALLVAACAPSNAGSSAPITDPAQPPIAESVALVPVTGEQAAETVHTAEQAPSLWSGEVFLSDNDTPDSDFNTTINAGQDEENVCFSEDSQPRRHGGCIE
jgi:hypothetical protein